MYYEKEIDLPFENRLYSVAFNYDLDNVNKKIIITGFGVSTCNYSNSKHVSLMPKKIFNIGKELEKYIQSEYYEYLTDLQPQFDSDEYDEYDIYNKMHGIDK